MEKNTKYQRAKKRVDDIRGFYNHLAIYLIVNVVLLLLRDKITFILLSKRVFGNPEILDAIDWDLFGTPIIWGIALLIHGLSVFGRLPFFGKKWEEKKIKEFMGRAEHRDKWK